MNMTRQELIRKEVSHAAVVLKAGGTLIYPSDTIWGLGCDAGNEQAIQKIYELKKRPPEKGMIVLVHDERLLMKYVREVPEMAWDLINFSERPLTLVYPGAINLPKSLPAPDGSIAIRIVKSGFAHELMRFTHRPLISTSANLSGERAPLSFDEIPRLLLEAVDYVVDLQAAPAGPSKPSVIMKIETNGRFTFLRH